MRNISATLNLEYSELSPTGIVYTLIEELLALTMRKQYLRFSRRPCL